MNKSFITVLRMTQAEYDEGAGNDNHGIIEIVDENNQPTGQISLAGNAGNIGADVGDIKLTAKATPPAGWLVCDGGEVSRETYASLFAEIGESYGAGDGSTTFLIPNLKGSVPVGFDAAQTEFNAMGKIGGAKTHTLTNNEMPTHNHSNGDYKYLLKKDNLFTVTGTDNSSGEPNLVYAGEISNRGGGQAHNNLQPYVVMNYIIKF